MGSRLVCIASGAVVSSIDISHDAARVAARNSSPAERVGRTIKGTIV